MACLFPMVAAFQCTFGIDQDIGDVLYIADFIRSLAHLQQWIVAGTARIGGIEQETVGEAAAPSCGELPVLPLDVVYDDTLSPRKQRRHDQANAFAGTRWRERHHMLGTVMAQI